MTNNSKCRTRKRKQTEISLQTMTKPILLRQLNTNKKGILKAQISQMTDKNLEPNNLPLKKRQYVIRWHKSVKDGINEDKVDQIQHTSTEISKRNDPCKICNPSDILTSEEKQQREYVKKTSV